MTTQKLKTYLFIERHRREKEKTSRKLEEDICDAYNQQNLVSRIYYEFFKRRKKK